MEPLMRKQDLEKKKKEKQPIPGRNRRDICRSSQRSRNYPLSGRMQAIVEVLVGGNSTIPDHLPQKDRASSEDFLYIKKKVRID